MKKIFFLCVAGIIAMSATAQTYKPGELFCRLSIKNSFLGSEAHYNLSLNAPYFSATEVFSCNSGGLTIMENDLSSLEKCNFLFTLATTPGPAAAGSVDLGERTTDHPQAQDFNVTVKHCSNGDIYAYGCKRGSLVITKIENGKIYGSFAGTFEESFQPSGSNQASLTGRVATISSQSFALAIVD